MKSLSTLPLTVFHGTTTEYLLTFTGIDLTKSRNNLDFGKGFYTTSNYNQASRFAQGRCRAYMDEVGLGTKEGFVRPLIMEYTVDIKSLLNLNPYLFRYPDTKWAEFVYNNRIGQQKVISDFHNWDNQYHCTYGHLADAVISTLIYNARNGIIEYDEFIKQILPLRPEEEDQLVLHTTEAIRCVKLKRRHVDYEYVYGTK